MELLSATINFYFLSFQIRVSNAVVVPVHHSSFGSSPLIYLSFFLSHCLFVKSGK